MDDGQGRMRRYEDDAQKKDLQKQFPDFGSSFSVGELIKLKESVFEISRIIRDGLKLKLIPKSEYAERGIKEE